MLFTRFLRRYLNMRSKEFIKMLKRKLNHKKELAHRKKIEGKAGKTNKRDVERKILDDIIADKTDGFASSHLILKAKALTGQSAFSKLNKATLHCLFRLYDIVFPARKTKEVLCQMLQQKILQVNTLPCPERVQAERFARIKENHQNKKEIDDFQDSVSQPNARNATEGLSMQSQLQLPTNEVTHPSAATASLASSINLPCENPVITAINEQTAPAEINFNQASDLHHPAENRQRRTRFKPTDEQLSLLKEDNVQNRNKTLNLKRAHDFGVHISQIENWHRRYKKQRKTSPGTCM